jgi:aryl-alcohol dehydrogenase-like predicted oxidoreductase
MSENRHPSRREAIRIGLAAGVGLSLGRLPLSAQLGTLHAQQQLPLITKKIPSTGEMLPVVGIGTNRFGVSTPEEKKPLCDVLRKLSELGGKVVDTARGYGSSEVVIGECVKEIGNRDKLFIVSKYSIGRGAAGDPKAALEEAVSRLQMDKLDVMMVHNLGGTDTLLPLMREMKEAGRFKYIGISISSDNSYAPMMEYMKSGVLDFIEVDYSIGNRNSEEQVLPLAQEKGIAVLCNVPFGGRRATVLQEMAAVPVPAWTKEFDATSWAQVFLKYVVSNPAVTAVIPGTTKVEHAIDNHGAARGRLPDAAMRKRIEEAYDAATR